MRTTQNIHTGNSCIRISDNIGLTGEYIVHPGRKLFRIIALRDFHRTKKGELGGFVQFPENIRGDGWVGENAKVLENARIEDSATVKGEAVVSGDAHISRYAVVKGSAKVDGHAKIFDWATVSGNATVTAYGQVSGQAVVSGHAEVLGFVYGDSILTGKAHVPEFKQMPGLAA